MEILKRLLIVFQILNNSRLLRFCLDSLLILASRSAKESLLDYIDLVLMFVNIGNDLVDQAIDGKDSVGQRHQALRQNIRQVVFKLEHLSFLLVLWDLQAVFLFEAVKSRIIHWLLQ